LKWVICFWPFAFWFGLAWFGVWFGLVSSRARKNCEEQNAKEAQTETKARSLTWRVEVQFIGFPFALFLCLFLSQCFNAGRVG